MYWHLSNRADQRALPIANRHYNRQKPWSPQFVPPGRCLVLLTSNADALWITSWPFGEFVKHQWPGAWICSCFRNESKMLSSTLIRQAVAATAWAFCHRDLGVVAPKEGMVTFVDAAKVKPKRDPGRCFIKAGFKRIGKTKGGLIVLQMLPDQMPECDAPLYPAESLYRNMQIFELDRRNVGEVVPA